MQRTSVYMRHIVWLHFSSEHICRGNTFNSFYVMSIFPKYYSVQLYMTCIFVYGDTVLYCCSAIKGRKKIVISIHSSPFLIPSLWLFPFPVLSSLCVSVRVQLGDKGIEPESRVALYHPLTFNTLVISRWCLWPSAALCDELGQESSLLVPAGLV